MTGWTWRLALLGAVAAILAGCSGGHNGGGNVVVIPPPPALACQFGTVFCADFALAANTEPPKTASTDIIPLTLTAEPIPLH